MNNKSTLNNIVTFFLLPYMLCFGFYVQIFGEVAPGGGFQAGAIFTSAFIAYDLSIDNISKYVSSNLLVKIGSSGVLLYIFTGLYSFLSGYNFLNYNCLPGYNPQATGIILVELGVGIAVSAVLLLLYCEIRDAD